MALTEQEQQTLREVLAIIADHRLSLYNRVGECMAQEISMQKGIQSMKEAVLKLQKILDSNGVGKE